MVDGKWTFEIGGRKKGFAQIADLPDSYVVSDGVSVGRGNRIPSGSSASCIDTLFRRHDSGLFRHFTPDFSGCPFRTFPVFNSGLFRRKASHAAFAEAAEFVLTQRARSPAHGLTPHAPPGCWFSCGSRALREDLSSIDSLLPGAARRGETAPLQEIREGCECQSLSRNAEKAHLPIRRPWPSSWQRGCPAWRSRG